MNYRDLKLRLGCWVLLWTLVLSQGVAAQSGQLSAVLQVTHAGVELKRVNTVEWLSLPEDAQAPLTEGDWLRTDGSGRALIRLDDAAQLVLLPNSELYLAQFRTDDGYVVAMTLERGRLVQQTGSGLMMDYMLQAGEAEIVTSLSQFAVQVDPEQHTMLIVAEGQGQFVFQSTTYSIYRGFGVRMLDAKVSALTPLNSPLGFSQLVGQLDGCDGVVDATLPGLDGVYVRVGPGENFNGLGVIPDGQAVRLLGVGEIGGRYLVPYLSGFAWIVTNGVVTDCQNLPILPPDEQFVDSVINPTDDELNLLEPFFGLPQGDQWFYRYE